MSHRHRHPIRSRSAVLGMTCLGLLAFAPAASAAAREKVTICHATGSATNPYVQITVSDNAVEAHRAHKDGRDIVPAPATGCPGESVPPTTDVCPNILGDQASVPEGFIIDPAGNCVSAPKPRVIECVVSVGVTQTATTVTGTAADDTIDCTGASPGKTIDGFGGNDTITGTEFDDTIIGGEGNDTITSLGGNDVVSGNEGNDTITGGEGDDTVTGSEGNDTLTGSAGNDFLDGGDGDDTLSGGTGTNVLIGGLGTDTCDAGPCTV